VLAGFSIPIARWKDADREITEILHRWGLADEEIHTAWLLRSYPEQDKIPNFATMSRSARRSEVDRLRRQEIYRLQKLPNSKIYHRRKKDFAHTSAYIHLTRDERKAIIKEVADRIGSWSYAKIFAECIDKVHFDPVRTKRTVDEQAFEQVVSRFEYYLNRPPEGDTQKPFGLLIHDNNQTIALKHTRLMRRFHDHGTPFTPLSCTIETPLFVNSSLTRMIQIADLCSYAIRRFCENQEIDLFRRILPLMDRVAMRAVGIRHFAGRTCQCEICDIHHRGKWAFDPLQQPSAAPPLIVPDPP
jgi:hypothetical protein